MAKKKAKKSPMKKGKMAKIGIKKPTGGMW